PQPLAGPGVQRKHHSLRGTAKNQIARSRHESAPRRSDDLVLPFDIACQRGYGDDLAPTLLRAESRPAAPPGAAAGSVSSAPKDAVADGGIAATSATTTPAAPAPGRVARRTRGC